MDAAHFWELVDRQYREPTEQDLAILRKINGNMVRDPLPETKRGFRPMLGTNRPLFFLSNVSV